MEMPGMSIFQGNESIKLVDTSLNRLEEEEALEDQRRRNEELGNELQNAFDDLIDDDDLTVDHSGNFQSQFERVDQQNGGGDGDVPHTVENGGTEKQAFLYGALIEKRINERGQGDHRGCEMEKERLQKSVETKASELENTKKLLSEERKRNDELKKRLTLSEAEKARAHMTRDQTHELLVESKMKISDLDNTVAKLKEKIKSLEGENTGLVGDLERTRLQLSDAQNKYHAVERNAGFSADRHAENVIKQANDRHAGQVELLQGQINCLTDKLETREREINALDARYKELQRNREALLVDKSETINQLARNLEESQRHCRELMSRPDLSQEAVRLQRLVKQYERQVDDMQKTINDLTGRLDATVAELNMMEGIVLSDTADISGNLRRLSLTKGNIVGSTPLAPVNDRLAHLKDELCRSIAGQKQKREEIRKLQEQVISLGEDIEKLRTSENNALIEATTLREENFRLTSRIRLVEIERDGLRTDVERETTARQDVENQFDELTKQNETVSKELHAARDDCRAASLKIDQLQSEVDDLLAKLEIKEQNDQLVAELKVKAQQFEDYIQHQKSSKESSTTMSPRKFHDRAVETSPELNSRGSSLDSESHRQQIESRIRNEMGKAFASKIKSMEDTFRERLQAIDAQNEHVKADMKAIYSELETREQEVDILKHAILREREKFQEVVEAKSGDVDELRAVLERARDELKSKQKQIDNLRGQLDEKSESIETERKSMKALIGQWTERQKSFDRHQRDLEAKLKEMKQLHGEKVRQLQGKCESAHTTSSYYKQYAEDKEKHMRQEYDRLKLQYDLALEKAKERMKIELEKEIRKLKETRRKSTAPSGKESPPRSEPRRSS